MSTNSDIKKTTVIMIVLDFILIVTPVILNYYFEYDIIAVLPAFIALILGANIWAARQILICDINEKIPLAKLRYEAKKADLVLYNYIDEMAAKLAEQLKHIKDGEIVLESDKDYWEYVMFTLGSVQGDVVALDVNTDSDMLNYWNHKKLEEYYDRCIEIVKMGYKFTRLFVFRKNFALDESGRLRKVMDDILNRQYQDGIDVHIIWIEELMLIARRIDVARDFLLFNDNKQKSSHLVIHAETPQGEPYYEEAIVSTRKQDLKEYSERYEKLLRHSITYEEFKKSLE